jgi:hypothetical protein
LNALRDCTLSPPLGDVVVTGVSREGAFWGREGMAMPKRDRKARRDARRLEQELIVARAELERERGNGRELAQVRDRLRTSETLLQEAGAAVARMATHAFKLHLTRGLGAGLVDDQQYHLHMALDRRMLDEMQMEGREFLAQRLAWEIIEHLTKAAYEDDRARPLGFTDGGHS